jgi:hypothetical protein
MSEHVFKYTFGEYVIYDGHEVQIESRWDMKSRGNLYIVTWHDRHEGRKQDTAYEKDLSPVAQFSMRVDNSIDLSRLHAALIRVREHEDAAAFHLAQGRKESSDTELALMRSALWNMWQALTPVMDQHPEIFGGTK